VLKQTAMLSLLMQQKQAGFTNLLRHSISVQSIKFCKEKKNFSLLQDVRFQLSPFPSQEKGSS
jgi:hypothetical protein